MNWWNPHDSKQELVGAAVQIKPIFPFKYDSEGMRAVLALVGMLMVMVSPGLNVVDPWGWIWVKYLRAGADSTLD
jgi:hypothetical protein